VKHPAARSGAAGLLVLAAACGGGGGATEVWHTPGATAAAKDPGSLASPAAPGAWQLVFQDEFDATSLNPALWATCYDWNNAGCTNAGNHELEWYLPGQVSVSSGALNLSAVRRTTAGTDGHVYPWASGMVTTGRDNWDAVPRRTFTGGYFAASIQIPAQAGMFPAFWLMPQTRETPPELDIAEFIGTTDTVQMTVHWPENGKNVAAAETYGPKDFPGGYHVFALDWEKDSLTWYVDGVARFHDTDPAHIPTGPMELLLNLAVGYPKAPPDDVSVANMKVDWVRVWQH
jgi:beta-glucanase (GH16 family)